MTNTGFGRRFGAILYDSLLALALMFLGTIPFIAVRGGEPVDAGDNPYRLTMLLITYLFFAGFWSGYGRTLGMQAASFNISYSQRRCSKSGSSKTCKRN